MYDNGLSTTANSLPASPTKPYQPPSSLAADSLPADKVIGGINISAEAQYMFEMDQYLFSLEATELTRTLAYMTTSEDKLIRQTVDNFTHSREVIASFKASFTGEALHALRKDMIVQQEKGLELLGKYADIPMPEIIVHPWASALFTMSVHLGSSPLSGEARDLTAQLEQLETLALSTMAGQDAVTVLNTVRQAIVLSGNIMTSVDEVVYTLYSIEKARKAIDYLDVPDALASSLTQLIDLSIVRQREQQVASIENDKQYIDNARIGAMARKAVIYSTAAMEFNNQLQSNLSKSQTSIVDSYGIMSNLLIQHTELITFMPEKIGGMLDYYREEFDDFQRFLDREFGTTIERDPLDTSLLDVGRDYAIKVIDEISAYLN